MTVIERQTFHDFPSVGALRRGPLIWCAGVFVFALLWQHFLFGANMDTSWIVTVWERMLAGDRLYVDIVEVNPPMTMWLYMPAVIFARAVGVAPEVAVHGYTYLACLAGLGFAAYIARRAEFEENPFLYRMLPVFLALLIVLPAYTFAQREHFGVALLLPLLTLLAWRIKAGRDDQPDVWLAVAAGLCGSMIVLVKPYYAVMIAAPAFYVAWRKRGIWWLFSAEYWTILCVCALYLAAVMLIYPEYLRDIVPVVVDTYMREQSVEGTVVLYGACFLPIIYFFFRYRPRWLSSPLIAVVMISSISGLIPLFYQGKGFPYHALPAFMLGLGALVSKMFQPGNDTNRAGGFSRHGVVILCVLSAAFPLVMIDKTDAAMVQTVRNKISQPTVGLIGPGLQIGHPFTRMVGGIWTGRQCSDWLGELALRFANFSRKAGDGVRARHYDDIAKTYIDDRVRALKSKPPQILLLQKQTDWVDHFLADPELNGFMDQYHLIAEDDKRLVFLRAAM